MANENIPMWVKVATGVVGFAILVGSTVGGVAWAMGKDSTSHDYVVDSLLKTDIRHDEAISKNAENIAVNKLDLHESELARTRLEGKIELFVAGQQATTKELTEIKDDFKEFTEYLMKFDYDKKKEKK